MLPREKRLRTAEVREVLKNGKSARSGRFQMRYLLPSGAGLPRFAAAAPKKTFGTAVRRNRMRRTIYAALAELRPSLPSRPLKAVVFALGGADGLSSAEVISELRELFRNSFGSL